MVTKMFNFEKRLLSRNYKDLNIKSIVIPDKGHQTIYPNFIKSYVGDRLTLL